MNISLGQWRSKDERYMLTRYITAGCIAILVMMLSMPDLLAADQVEETDSVTVVDEQVESEIDASGSIDDAEGSIDDAVERRGLAFNGDLRASTRESD